LEVKVLLIAARYQFFIYLFQISICSFRMPEAQVKGVVYLFQVNDKLIGSFYIEIDPFGVDNGKPNRDTWIGLASLQMFLFPVNDTFGSSF